MNEPIERAYHLSEEQKVRFIELYNEHKIKFSGDIQFYVLPSFMRLKE